MPSLLSVGFDRDPVGMRVVDILVHRMRIGPRDDDHAELSTAGHEIAERIALPYPDAAVMERNLRRVVRDDAAGAEAGGVGVNAREGIEPERGIESSGIVLDERQLRPAHGPIEPA